jgi:hypothetical protein
MYGKNRGSTHTKVNDLTAINQVQKSSIYQLIIDLLAHTEKFYSNLRQDMLPKWHELRGLYVA